MIKRGLVILVGMVLMGFSSIEVDRHVPPEVVETAKDNYREFLSFVFNDGNREEWRIGQFVAENQLVIDNKLNLTIRPIDLWIAPVLYNGVIIGSMRVSQPSEGRYEIVEFGYSKSFPPLQLKPDEYLLTNVQYNFDLGYAPSRDNIRPVGGIVRLFEEWGVSTEGISISEFEVLLIQHLKKTYPDRFPENPPVSRLYLALIPITTIAIVVALFSLRKIKRLKKLAKSGPSIY